MTEPQSTDQLREQLYAAGHPFPDAAGEVHIALSTVMKIVAPLLAAKQAEIEDLDTRRARWAEQHQKRWEERDAERSSRQDWAAEALRLEARVAELTRERDRLLADLAEQLAWYREQADQDLAALGRVLGVFEDAERMVRQAFRAGRPPAQEAQPGATQEAGEPLFRHANGEPCHGCQMCLADVSEVPDV
jgi:hypothetical protein